MDVNGTHFHLLLGRDDWARCLDAEGVELGQGWDAPPVASHPSGLAWDAEHFELTLQPRLFRFVATADQALPIEKRRGAARDLYENWYWIDDSGFEIRVNSSGTRQTSHFWSAGDGAECEPEQRFGDFDALEPKPAIKPLALSGLAVTEDQYLVVGTLDPKGILIFDLHQVGAPQHRLWPSSVDFAPFDMSPAPGGGVFILDRVNKCYWALDRRLNVMRLDQAASVATPDDFQPTDGSAERMTEERPFPEAITLQAASPIPARDPVAIEALPDGSVLILDNDASEPYSEIFHFHLGEEVGTPLSTDAVRDIVEPDSLSDFHLRGHDLCFVPKSADAGDPALLGRVYIVERVGNQSFAFDLFQRGAELQLVALAEYFPMRLFGGKGLVTAGGQPYYDFSDLWVPLMSQKRPRYMPQATLFTPPLDGREPECVWHRLMLDAAIPSGAQVQVSSRAANDPVLLPRAEWMQEPALHLRSNGSELPYVTQLCGTERGTFELLFQRVRGRYLQLKLVLNGNEQTSPRVRALRAYYPRFSYSEHYMPGVYREDQASASFLERYLANLEGTMTALEDKIAAAQILFDVRSAPPDVLDWLANWFGIALDPLWDEERRRLFIKHAMDFFQYRGTVRGLLIALHLALDACATESIFDETMPQKSAIRIVEKFRTRTLPAVALGDPTEASGPRILPANERWSLKSGGENLHKRYGDALHSSSSAKFPIRDPKDETSTTWHQFSRDTLSFVPAASGADLVRWREFLTHRYLTIAALNQAYGLVGTTQYASFEDVSLPVRLPQEGAQLQDWLLFEGIVVRMYATAHRFSVILPAPLRTDVINSAGMLPAPVGTDVAAEHQRRLDFAQRIVNLEKPAHTTFDVKFYWAMFRVGEARLGMDTLIDLGSRTSWLIRPLVLGQGYLSEGYLAPDDPIKVKDRQILGRECSSH